MIKPIRRVVTGHDARGQSVILSDGPSPHVLTIPGRPDFALTDLWVTEGAPASNAGTADPAARPVVLEPPRNGSIFRVVEFPPDQAPGGFDRAAAFAAMGADHAMDQDASRHPGMHKTDTVDYALVLTGEIWALMDDGETLLQAGDTLVQRGTNHAWSNRSDRPCLVAFILVSASPLGGKAGVKKPGRRAATRPARRSAAKSRARKKSAPSRRKARRRS
jgi:quercetin dioxygenase-like cupin family protein